MSKAIPVNSRERLIALKIVSMLREECKDNLIEAVKALALANQMFQQAFSATVNRFSRLQGNNDTKENKGE